MKKSLCLLLLAITTTISAQPAPPVSSIKAGFAERDITPGIGMEQPGGYGKSFHRSFHDACKARIAVFDDGKRKTALVGLDSLVVPRQLVLEAREEIAKATGIPGEAVLIAASHSHSSGPVGMVMPGEYDGANDVVKKLAYEDSSCADAGYLMRVKHEIVTGVKVANAALVPATVGFGFGHEDKVAFNRRIRMKNGQTWSHPGPGNPDIVGYAGPIDPQVGVIGAWDLEGRLLGSIVNFSCHATTSPGGISANWIYYMEQTLQGAMASRAPVVFFAAPCGDVTQVDNLSPYRRPEPEEWARLVGGRVGAEAVRVLLSMARGTEAVIDVKLKTLQIPRRKPSAARLERSHAMIAAGKPQPPADITDWTWAKEIVMLEYLLSKQPVMDVEVQAIQIGPSVFVSNPAEYFVQYGLDIKKGSPFPFTFPVELANGIVGYVPTEEAFGPNGGGYETRLSSYSNLEITGGTKIANAGIELTKQMTPGKIPERPKAPPFAGKGWGYGNVPPEVE
jgi:neutral ceramidase